ncbi:MAG: ribosomal RNA small subunit methyltransferase A [Erysipelotrichaceae bacterium]|nr:ribosomal RNA small subunit methyltransferase A [Erysipelotrichaceae bacterium]
MKVSAQQTRRLLEEYGIFASKKYGQNFLVDNNVISLIANSVEKTETIVEIGPGLGYLTDELADICEKLVAYEIDEKLLEPLRDNLKSHDNITVVNRDFLKADLSGIEGRFSLVSNLPYYITSDILIKLLCESERIDEIVVMMQKEVADKILHLSEVSPLTVLCHHVCDITQVTTVSKNCYYPKPEVDSSVLKMKVRETGNTKEFYKFLTACFRQKRKKLLTNLKDWGVTAETLREAGLSEEVRSEQLRPEDFYRLYELTTGC